MKNSKRDMLATMLLSGAIFAAVVGCDRSEKHTPAAETVNSAPKEAQLAPKAAEVPDGGAASGASAFFGALGEAASAATGASNEGGPPCEEAYNGLDAMVKSLEKKFGKGDGKGLPPKREFLATCEELPEANQRCLVMSYAMDHAVECAEAKDKLDPKLAAKMKKLGAK